MSGKPRELLITVPDWVDETVGAFAEPLDDEDARMRLAIRLSRENVLRGGGPFGAIVCAGSQVVGAGVNRVLATGLSIAHAEIVALMRAQLRLAADGGGATGEPLSLVTSTEPCCQCYGAVVWSGVQRLVCGALTCDAEAVGFDEGPKPAAWTHELERRGISVRQSVCREAACEVLQEYRRRGGPIYGLRSPAMSDRSSS
jgi:tRNA(Arg) A34 adenosine deaminase TadA